MPKITIYNQEGKDAGTIELNDTVFGVKSKISVLHQVYEALRANAREPWADTKNRGEVSGGGKKPWKQKGTGRARHGSIRSPIWKGGGVTFGPLSTRNYTQKINQKMKQQAVRMCLSDKAKEGKLIVMEELTSDGKTKTMAALRQKLPCAKKTTLILADGNDLALRRSTKNIEYVSTIRAEDVNVVNLLDHQYVVLSKSAVQSLEKRLQVHNSAK